MTLRTEKDPIAFVTQHAEDELPQGYRQVRPSTVEPILLNSPPQRHVSEPTGSIRKPLIEMNESKFIIEPRDNRRRRRAKIARDEPSGSRAPSQTNLSSNECVRQRVPIPPQRTPGPRHQRHEDNHNPA